MRAKDPTSAIGWQFPPAVWRRGEDVHAQGLLADVLFDPLEEAFSAMFIGSAGQPHQVWVWFEQPDFEARAGAGKPVDLDGDCECPEPKPCRHVAALAMTVLLGPAHDDDDDDDLANAPERPRPSPAPSRLPPAAARRAFTEWARGLAIVRDPAPDPSPPPLAVAPQPELVFVVEAVRELGTPRVAITPWVLWPHTVQGPGDDHPYDLDAALTLRTGTRPTWLPDDALAVWVRLQTLPRKRSGLGARVISLDAHGARVLADAIATGICRLDTPDGLPLSPGAPRPAQLVWRLDAEAHQQLHVEPEGAGEAPWRILPLAPLHYVEVLTGECGVAILPLPAIEQVRLLTVPGVDPTWAGALSPTLRATLREAGIPLPRALAIGRARRGRPLPVLRLFAHPTAAGPMPTASLSFDYEGATVFADDGRPTVIRIEDNRVDRLTRDVDAEQAARALLAARGLLGDSRALTLADPDRWFSIARTDATELEALGWRVEVADNFEWTTTAVDAWYADGRSAQDEDAQQWFLELGVVIDGERVNILPAVVAAIRSGSLARDRLRVGGVPLVVTLADGRRVEVEAARLQAILDVLVELHDNPALEGGALRLAKLDAVRLGTLPDFTWTVDAQLQAFAERLMQGPAPGLEPPIGLNATLRDYQLHGLAWLQWLREGGLGGVLADDMGLGKTIQALGHILLEKQNGRLTHPALVVAPRSVLSNWLREAERFTPALRTTVYHGPDRDAVLADPSQWDLVITTFALLQRDERLLACHWHLAILDEAQQVKNPAAKVAIAARALHAEQRVCMTGTPVENNLRDLWSLMSFANPGLLGNGKQFATWYRTPIETHGNTGRFDALCRRIAPFMLRRTKADVLGELPPKTEVVLHATLEGPQRDLYESVRLTMEKKVRDELVRRGLARSQIVVLDALLKLRQVCCDPRLLKLARTTHAPDSAKLVLLLELVEELVSEGRRALVFSQFTSMLARIEEALDARRIPWLSITGKTRARQEIVDRFQAGEVPILLVSLKAGGTGLNLTAADTVIHYDPWWNPAVEAQATDRAHRIGQTQPVTVYRLICDGTVEERMLALQAKKSALVRSVHDSAERRASAGLRLEAEDVAALLAPMDRDDRTLAPRRSG